MDEVIGKKCKFVFAEDDRHVMESYFPDRNKRENSFIDTIKAYDHRSVTLAKRGPMSISVFSSITTL